MQDGERELAGGNWSLAAVTDVALEAELRRLVRANARTEAWVVAHLMEVEVRRLHLLAGFASMFEYCLEHLKLGDFEAFLRITAARTAAKYPVILDLMERQELHLTAIRLLREHLTAENHRELLAEAAGKSKRQIEVLLARRFPRRDVPERLRRLPKLEPLAPGRYRLELTIDERLKDKLELARDLLSHANPTRDLATVIARGVDALLDRLERRRFGKRSPRAEPETEAKVEHQAEPQAKAEPEARPEAEADAEPETEAEAETEAEPETEAGAKARRAGRRWVPNEVRRRVLERDGLRCTYVGTDGRRCTSRAFLELDHAEAWARGGDDSYENLHVLCAQHNQLKAERDFGRGHVVGAIERKCREGQGGLEPTGKAPGREMGRRFEQHFAQARLLDHPDGGSRRRATAKARSPESAACPRAVGD